MADTTLEIWQDGLCVVTVSAADPDAAMAEAMHYAIVYAQDGPVELRGPSPNQPEGQSQ